MKQILIFLAVVAVFCGCEKAETPASLERTKWKTTLHGSETTLTLEFSRSSVTYTCVYSGVDESIVFYGEYIYNKPTVTFDMDSEIPLLPFDGVVKGNTLTISVPLLYSDEVLLDQKFIRQ